MTRSNEHLFEPEYAESYQRRRILDAIEARDGHPDIPPQYLDAMTLALTAGYNRYGNPASPTYQEFHNDIHFLNVTTGSWRVLDFMRDDLKLPVDNTDYIVGGLIGPLHDIIHEAMKNGVLQAGTFTVDFGEFSISVESDGTKTDEVLSAEVAVLFLKYLGIPEDVIQRVANGILLTEVSFETGTPVQKGAGKGGRDYGAIAAAIADTEGIFGGEERLSKDIARLVSEALGEKVSDEGLVTAYINKFIDSEVSFVRQKLAEFALHILGTEDNPAKKQELNDALVERFAPLAKIALKNGAAFDAHIQRQRDKIHAHIQAIQQQIASFHSRDNHSQE